MPTSPLELTGVVRYYIISNDFYTWFPEKTMMRDIPEEPFFTHKYPDRKLHPMQKKDKKILIIEDEPEVLEPLGELLAIEGYTVITASHPGLGAARAPYADCIILDLQLTPENKVEGGMILSQIWQDTWCKTPVIIFSGMVGMVKIDEILKRIEEIGGNGRNIFRCISKIDGIESVITAVNEWYETIRQST